MDKIDTTIFSRMTKEQLEEIAEKLKEEKKKRTTEFIKPAEKQYLKPVQDKYIKPLKEKYLKPIDKIMKELKTYLPKEEKPAYMTINGKRYGPLTKKQFVQMIVEVEQQQ